MKKVIGVLAVFAMVMTVASVASANSIVIPFFADGGTPATVSTQAGNAAFINLKNLGSDTITFYVDYRGTLGEDGTPDANSDELGPYATVSFRPVATDPNREGVGTGNDVPNAKKIGRLATGNGGVTISSEGDIVSTLVGKNLETDAMWAYEAAAVP
ncbi:MAG: hypothetical protein KAJ01_08660 [Candidatus Hydrogenedentes bacterium]|nr:hypothetical protein [Candidatus Hydrogenedentota bacterium]